jgi:hypothetical protein
MQKGRKLNCWDFRKCGREQGGARERELGVCPAAVEVRMDGVHHGKNAGRACWVVVGTLCENDREGSFVKKYASCTACDFYKLVKKEEGGAFLLTTLLLKRKKFG